MNDQVNIVEAKFEDDGHAIRGAIALRNDGQQGAYAYRSVRAQRFDPASKVLEIQLSDRGIRSGLMSSFIIPGVVAIRPGATESIRLDLSRTIVRLDNRQRGSLGARTERLDAFSADSIHVEIAWSDRPLPTGLQRGDIQSWPRGFATCVCGRSTAPGSWGNWMLRRSG
jgi:hypothetical protein